jgi:hypothetical protein
MRILAFFLILVMPIVLSGCMTYDTTCWSEGEVVYKNTGPVGMDTRDDFCPQPLDKDYWKLPNGEVIQGRCECLTW